MILLLGHHRDGAADEGRRGAHLRRPQRRPHRLGQRRRGPGRRRRRTTATASSPCSPANAPMFAQLAANAIQRPAARCPRTRSRSCGSTRPTTRAIPGANGCTRRDGLRRELRQVQVGQGRRTSSATSAARWPSKSVNACANNSPDSVGVYMKAKHDFLTGFFTDSVDIEDHAVFTFEPLPTLTCAARRTREHWPSQREAAAAPPGRGRLRRGPGRAARLGRSSSAWPPSASTPRAGTSRSSGSRRPPTRPRSPA